MTNTGTDRFLDDVAADFRDAFEAERRVVSFAEYLALIKQDALRHTRDAGRYLLDCFDYFGTREVDTPLGTKTRWKLFDLEFVREDTSEGLHLRIDRLVGQEDVQLAVYQTLSGFVREGRPNKLVLLHGPNGSAKSTFVAAIVRALEYYSKQPEGALYRFSWIFPRGSDQGGIGFGAFDSNVGDAESFAHLPEDRIDLKMASETREHPLLLLPKKQRREFLRALYREAGSELTPPDWIWHGDLSPKNHAIREALVTAYRGDYKRVLAHVQVERYYISQRYRSGAVTIGPEMAVDARERQITADRSLHALPASLSSLTLYDVHGDLVDGSGGLIEFSDLLKRPLDAWKYLLTAIETGEVSLSMSNLQLNSVMMATSNELHLNAFREHHEYLSFRGRLSLIRTPYLLNYEQERQIYDNNVCPQLSTEVAPYTTYVAALWAVLTRLRRPSLDNYEHRPLGKLAMTLSPLEKADFYAQGTVPSRMSTEEASELRRGRREVIDEWRYADEYEGLSGASAREIRGILLRSAQRAATQEHAHEDEKGCLTPQSVLEHISTFCETQDYDFLKQSPQDGYRDHRGFVQTVRKRWLDLVDRDLQRSAGFVDETQYYDLFDRYVTHVSTSLKREQLYNPVTKKYDDPDQELMERVESMLDFSESAADFRRNLISTVAGFAIDHPGQEVDYRALFPRYLERVQNTFFQERTKQVMTLAQDMLMLLSGGPVQDAARRQSAEQAAAAMQREFHYSRQALRLILGELVTDRYRLG